MLLTQLKILSLATSDTPLKMTSFIYLNYNTYNCINYVQYNIFDIFFIICLLLAFVDASSIDWSKGTFSYLYNKKYFISLDHCIERHVIMNFTALLFNYILRKR